MLRFKCVPDYHMHTPRCNHAIGTIAEYAQFAVNSGLTEIGMSDHSPMPNGFDKAWRMDESELDSYFQELEDVKNQFSNQLSIKVGLEVDYYPGAEDYIQNLTSLYNWDYLIGSVHFIDGWGFDNPDEIDVWNQRNVEEVYASYYELVGKSAASGLFDIIGHPDLVKKFGFRPKAQSQLVSDAEDKMLKTVKQAGVALEVSSAGLRKPVGEIYPAPSLIEKAARLEIPFSYGSDAHSPTEVGHAMNECLALLHQYGIEQVASFTQRKREMKCFLEKVIL